MPSYSCGYEHGQKSLERCQDTQVLKSAVAYVLLLAPAGYLLLREACQ